MVFSFTSRNSTCNEYRVSYVVTRVCQTKGNNLDTYLNMMRKNLTLYGVTGLKNTSSIRGVDLARADPVAQEAFESKEYDISLWVLSAGIRSSDRRHYYRWVPYRLSAVLSTFLKCGCKNRTLTAAH